MKSQCNQRNICLHFHWCFHTYYCHLNAAVKAKINSGISLEDAYDYSTLGCVEITIGGREFSNTEEARINWLKILELLLFNGRCALTGKEWHLKENHVVEEFTSFNAVFHTLSSSFGWNLNVIKGTSAFTFIDASIHIIVISLLQSFPYWSHPPIVRLAHLFP